MSDAGQPIEDPKPVLEQDGSIPETVVPAEPVTEQPEAEEAPAEVKAEEAPKETKKPWFQTRIDELTRKSREAERKATDAEARAAVLEAANKPADDGSKPQLTQADFDKAVEAKAKQLASAERQNARAQSWLSAGVKDYGMEDFNARCDLVASLGAEDRPEFMQIVTDPDIIPDGHKVVALMADHPEEAQRILALDPMKMAVAIARFAQTAEKPVKAISAAPRPITPIGGSARSSAPSDTDDIKTWVAKRNAHLAAKANGTAH